MLGDFNPLQSIPLTVVTSQLVILGTLRTRLRRLTDVLNEPDCHHLVLLDATFMEVGSRRLLAEAAASQVQFDDVLFVHANGATESDQVERTPKQPVRAVMIAPPFTIEGQIHLPLESELHLALDAFEGKFVPVTNARYWAYGVAESPNYADLVVVNHAHVHVAVPPGVVWNREAPSAGSRGQNPW